MTFQLQFFSRYFATESVGLLHTRINDDACRQILLNNTLIVSLQSTEFIKYCSGDYCSASEIEGSLCSSIKLTFF